jgi:putative phage-type endonuclease
MVDRSLIQGTPEWVAARARRIGSSDIPVIMRCSPYKKRRILWEEMTKRRAVVDIGGLPHVRRGVRGEAIARRMLEKIFGVTYQTPTLLHPRYKQMAASVDGICDDHLIEIKTMGARPFALCRDQGIIPEHYKLQIQWQLMISGLRTGYFVAFKPEENELADPLEVVADSALQRHLLANALIFFRWVVRDTPPRDEVAIAV